jgi:polyvinyl alcohol dehydrogenase (cytochrome)
MRFVVLSLALVLLMVAVVGAPAAVAEPDSSRGWPSAGQNISNTHSQPDEMRINAGDVGGLAPAWTFTTNASTTTSATSDVSATPTVVDGTAYFPDWGGWLYAVDASTGKTRWAHKISEYTGVAGTFSRTSPAIFGDLLILGDKPPSGIMGWGQTSTEGAHILAVNAHTGNLVWKTQVDSTFVSQITSSPVVFDGKVYVGVSSVEEVTAAFVPNYQCCIFRGSEVSLDARTGKILWQTFVAPQGYTGNAVWGSTGAIDPGLGLLFVGTGNNYSVPDSVLACQNAGGTNCVAPDDFFDSLLALDLRSGAIRWATDTIKFDDWTVACVLTQPQENCPSPSSPDADFGSGPNFFRAGGKKLVGAGTKAGTYWTLDAATGKVVWATPVGPGGVFGGIEWDSSVADGRVYVALSNSSHISTALKHPAPGSPSTTTGGFWAALKASTGEVLWQQADPAGPTFGDIAGTATANGVVYVGSSDKQGNVFALDAATGQIKWNFATGGSVAAGASIVNGTVYWGSGYSQFANQPAPSTTTGNNKVYAFSLPRDDDNQD